MHVIEATSIALFLTLAQAQQIYIPATGTSTRPQCSATPALRLPSYAFSSFAFTQNATVRTATAVPRTAVTTYGPPYACLSSLAPAQTTTWGNWNPNDTAATDTSNPYGKAAFSSLWQRMNLKNFTFTGVYSTTVSPTPVPTSELVLPPQNYFGPTDCYNFPSDFVFGVAGSAGQIEGAAAREGRTPSILDLIGTTLPVNNLVGNENYYLYKQDILRLAAMGVEYYSFSISWSRILPFAVAGSPVNKEGIDHYNDVINYVLEIGMKPIVTLIHFDTPVVYCGYNLTECLSRRALIGFSSGQYDNATWVEDFVNYGKIIFTHFADRVPVFYTYNEPLLFSTSGKAVDNVLKSHAQLYHFYHDVIKGKGKISLKLNNNFGVPRNATNPADISAADHFNAFQLAIFANPIFLGIDYPSEYKNAIKDYVPLSAADLTYINGTADYMSVDPYTITVTGALSPSNYTACQNNISDPLFANCVTQSDQNIFGWDVGYRSQSYVYTTPRFLRSYLNFLWSTYRKPIVVSEFGFPVYGEASKTIPDQQFDFPRSDYYLSYMSEILAAVWEDHVHVIGAIAWSFVDNWEFGSYDSQFGLQVVERPSQKRHYKKSFFDLVDFVQTRKTRLTSLGR